LKLAVTFDPQNEQYRQKYELASSRAQGLMASRYYKQARFHESVGRWEMAAKLYSKAADHDPQADYLCKAASALTMTGELRRAQEYATKAVGLEPENAAARIALAQVFTAAGMNKNAKRELEAALSRDPDNELAKTLLKDVRKRT